MIVCYTCFCCKLFTARNFRTKSFVYHFKKWAQDQSGLCLQQGSGLNSFKYADSEHWQVFPNTKSFKCGAIQSTARCVLFLAPKFLIPEFQCQCLWPDSASARVKRKKVAFLTSSVHILLMGIHNFIYFHFTSLMWQIDMYNAIPLCLRQKPFLCICIISPMWYIFPVKALPTCYLTFIVSALFRLCRKKRKENERECFAIFSPTHQSVGSIVHCSGVFRVSVNNIWCDHKSRFWLLFTGGRLKNGFNEGYNVFDLFARVF